MGNMTLAVAGLHTSMVGQPVLIIEIDEDDDSRIETSGILTGLIRKLDESGQMVSMKVHLGGNDASAKNGMLFTFDAQEANSPYNLYRTY